jgi:von Willebrand factor type A domain
MGWTIFQTEFGGQSTPEVGTLFILDTSLSMSVEDIASESGVMRSRLDTAKELIRDATQPIWPRALMTFASTARLQLPLSHDGQLWQDTLDTLSPVRYGSMTDIETALASAILAYGTTPLHIVLITDGETTTDIATQTGVVLPESMNLTLIGIATAWGGRIIDHYDGDGRIVYKIYEGRDVVSRLDLDHLKQLGTKYHAQLALIEKSSDVAEVHSFLSQQQIQNPIGSSRILFILAALLVLIWLMIRDYRIR